MPFLPDPVPGRREFFRAAARYGVLSLLALGGVLTARTRRLAGQTCINQGICLGCSAFSECSLPQAISAKESKTTRTL
jgi:hypothetical protein